MKNTRNRGLDIEIDKLTNSIENISTGEVFDTDIFRLTETESNQIIESDWQFD